MFNFDLWQEIYGTVRRNKLRTFLTGLAVAWGIFMLVVLLAAGKGLQNGIEHQFRDDALNSIWIWAGKTSAAWGGHPIGRQIALTNSDFEALKRLPEVKHITARVNLWNEGVVTRGQKKSAFFIQSVHPDHRFLENTLMVSGRYLHELDQVERRKVAVIGDEVRNFLFKRGEDPLGQWITINGIEYVVIGVFQDEGGERERRKIFIPISTAQMAYGGAQGGSNRVNQIMLTVGQGDVLTSKRVEERIRKILAERHRFSPDDKRALRIHNNLQEYEKVQGIFTILELFVWVVGCLTILAGIVGVSNIMLIAVRERTREIGIRKSFGATPGSILRMVTQEAVVLTAVAGYLGLAAGVGLVELVTSLLPPIEFFRDPQVDMRIALTATALLVVSGTLAGFVPAWRAARINPIEALRDE